MSATHGPPPHSPDGYDLPAQMHQLAMSPPSAPADIHGPAGEHHTPPHLAQRYPQTPGPPPPTSFSVTNGEIIYHSHPAHEHEHPHAHHPGAGGEDHTHTPRSHSTSGGTPFQPMPYTPNSHAHGGGLHQHGHGHPHAQVLQYGGPVPEMMPMSPVPGVDTGFGHLPEGYLTPPSQPMRLGEYNGAGRKGPNGHAQANGLPPRPHGSWRQQEQVRPPRNLQGSWRNNGERGWQVSRVSGSLCRHHLV